MKWSKKSLSHVWLCDPLDYTVHGILYARILEWVAYPFSRGSSQPRDRTQVSCTAGRFFTKWTSELLLISPWDPEISSYICSIQGAVQEGREACMQVWWLTFRYILPQLVALTALRVREWLSPWPPPAHKVQTEKCPQEKIFRKQASRNTVPLFQMSSPFQLLPASHCFLVPSNKYFIECPQFIPAGRVSLIKDT